MLTLLHVRASSVMFKIRRCSKKQHQPKKGRTARYKAWCVDWGAQGLLPTSRREGEPNSRPEGHTHPHTNPFEVQPPTYFRGDFTAEQNSEFEGEGGQSSRLSSSGRKQRAEFRVPVALRQGGRRIRIPEFRADFSDFEGQNSIVRNH